MVAIKAPILGENSLDRLQQALNAFFSLLEVEINRVGPGIIVFHAGQSVPEGWIGIEALRQTFNQTKYDELFAALGSTWGSTATTFNIPAIADLPPIPGAGRWIIKV